MLISFIVVTAFFFAVTFILGRFAGQRWDDKQSDAIITYGAAAAALIACYGAFVYIFYVPTAALAVAIFITLMKGAVVYLILEGIAAFLLLVINFWVPFAITRRIINRYRRNHEPVADETVVAPANEAISS